MKNRIRYTWVITPDKKIYRRRWEAGTFPALRWWQHQVEGHIELMPKSEDGLWAVVNDVGLYEKPVNTLFTSLWYRFNGGDQPIGTQVFHGSAVFVTGMVMNCETCREIDDQDPGERLELHEGLDSIITIVCPGAPG